MPGWLKNQISKISDAVVDQVTEQLVAHAGDLGPTVESLKAAGLKCNSLALETTELCRGTETIGDTMLSIGSELQETLSGFQGAVDASAFETIQNLLSGDKLQIAMRLAKDMNIKATECVDKSMEMIKVMEDTMDKLPDPLEKAIDHAMMKNPGVNGSNEAMESLSTFDKDVEDVETCIASIKKLNLFTALEVGLKAFESFKDKAQVSRDMFGEIRGYSQTVVDISKAFQELDVVTIMHKIKDMWKCIALTGLMKKLAEGVGKLIRMVIALFEETSGKVAGLWKALAFAKDCMMDCASHVKEAKELCVEAAQKSSILVTESRSITGKLGAMSKVDAGSFTAFRDLADGEEIRNAVGIAEIMDDLVLKCAEKAMSMIDRVKEGFANLPLIVTDGIPPEAGKEGDDPEPVDVEQNVLDLEACKASIEGADVFHAVESGVRGFSDVSDKVGTAKELLCLIEGFAQSCLEAIESFMGVWDIESAKEKIIKLLRLANLGEMMNQFASQVKRLILAVIALMKSATTKFSNLKVKDLTSNLGQNVGQVLDLVHGVDVDDLKKLKFW
jgi:hypothetical protein